MNILFKIVGAIVILLIIIYRKKLLDMYIAGFNYGCLASGVPLPNFDWAYKVLLIKKDNNKESENKWIKMKQKK